MDTEFAFLKRLEQDLLESARVERRRVTERARTRRSHRRTWIGAAASFLVIAFAIGFLAQGGGFGSSSMSSAAGSFSTVGSAVDGQGGDQSKQGVNGAPADVPAPQAWLGQSGGASYSVGQTNNRSASTSEPADLSKIIRDGAMAVMAWYLAEIPSLP